MEGSDFLDQFKPIMSSFIASTKDYNLASVYHEAIQKEIEEFSQGLAEHEVIMVTVPLNHGTNVIVEWFGYHNPSMIIIGIQPEDERKVRLLIHQADLQIVMQRIKPEAGKPPTRKIGFQTREKEAEHP